VTLLNAVDGCIPSDLATGSPQEIEEETATAVRGDDARQGSSAGRRAAAFYVTSSRVTATATSMLQDALHSARDVGSVRDPGVA